jgi:hypothetical protein
MGFNSPFAPFLLFQRPQAGTMVETVCPPLYACVRDGAALRRTVLPGHQAGVLGVVVSFAAIAGKT